MKEISHDSFKPRFNILLYTQSIVCATVQGQYLEYLGCITLTLACLPACDVRYITFFSSVFVMQHVRPRRGINIFVMTNEGETE